MAPGDDKTAEGAADQPAAAPADKTKDAGRAKSGAAGPRQLNREELEALRRQLQKKFHRR